MQCRFVDLSRKTWKGNLFLQDFTRSGRSICVNSSLSLRCKCCRETRNSRRQQTWICFMKNCVKFFLTWEKRNGENLLWLGRSDAARHERRAIESTVTIVVSMVELVQLDADGKLRFSSSHAEDLFLGFFFPSPLTARSLNFNASIKCIDTRLHLLWIPYFFTSDNVVKLFTLYFN